jgi:FkbM family methyltransferase
MLKQILGVVSDLLLPMRTQLRIGRYLANRSMADSNGDPEKNGEYRLVDELCISVLQPGAIVFDVGANIGDWSGRVAQGFKGKIFLYAFEPASDTFTVLEKRFAKLSAQEAVVKCFNIALGKGNDIVTLYKGAEFSGTNSLLKPMHNVEKILVSSKEMVSVQEGDGFCESNDISYIDFVKIDTEGYEISVLKGFSNYIRNGKIGAIQFEYGGSWIDSRTYLLDAFEIFLSHGYKIGKIYPDGIRWYESYDQELENFRYSNFLAAKKSISHSFKQMIWK